jgi:hypothetical protein
MAIAAFAPVLPNQKKQCYKIARFTDAPVRCAGFVYYSTTTRIPKFRHKLTFRHRVDCYRGYGATAPCAPRP